MISEIPKDIDPIKSFREVRSQSQISTKSRLSLSSGFKSMVSVWKKKTNKTLSQSNEINWALKIWLNFIDNEKFIG